MQPLIVRSRGFCPCCLTEFERFRPLLLNIVILGRKNAVGPGSAPASGAPIRRTRRMGEARQASPNGVTCLRISNVVGEGASHNARGGRGPLQLHGYR